MKQKHANLNAILNDTFWFTIYNAPTTSLAAIERAINEGESNPKIRKLLDGRLPELVRITHDECLQRTVDNIL